MQTRSSKLRRWRTRSSGDRRLTPPYDLPNRGDQDVFESRRTLRIIFRKLTQLFLLVSEPEPVLTHRVSGDMQCVTCAQPYVLHPEHPHARWLTVLCDSRRVKL